MFHRKSRSSAAAPARSGWGFAALQKTPYPRQSPAQSVVCGLFSRRAVCAAARRASARALPRLCRIGRKSPASPTAAGSPSGQKAPSRAAKHCTAASSPAPYIAAYSPRPRRGASRAASARPGSHSQKTAANQNRTPAARSAPHSARIAPYPASSSAVQAGRKTRRAKQPEGCIQTPRLSCFSSAIRSG